MDILSYSIGLWQLFDLRSWEEAKRKNFLFLITGLIFLGNLPPQLFLQDHLQHISITSSPAYFCSPPTYFNFLRTHSYTFFFHSAILRNIYQLSVFHIFLNYLMLFSLCLFLQNVWRKPGLFRSSTPGLNQDLMLFQCMKDMTLFIILMALAL